MRRKKHLEQRLALCESVNLGRLCGYADIADGRTPPERFDVMRVFGNTNGTHLEIGCGKGAFAVRAAQLYPDINFIAAELSENVLVSAMEKAIEAGLPNLRFLSGNAANLEQFFPENSVERIYLNFSCPFPKERYKKYRLTHRAFLDIYKRILVSGGEIHQKTDNMKFFEFSIESLSACGFTLKNISLDLHASDFENNIVTEYEQRFTQMGLPIYRLEAVNP